jgi:hypothetical protein
MGTSVDGWLPVFYHAKKRHKDENWRKEGRMDEQIYERTPEHIVE